jgi:hypothetical protein
MLDGALERLPLGHERQTHERAQPALVANLYVAGWMPLVALLAGIISLIYLITTSSVVGTGYNIQRLERERDEWHARNAQLELELAKVRSLPWVEAQATTRMGMVKSERPAFVAVDHTLAADSGGRPSERVSSFTNPVAASAGP